MPFAHRFDVLLQPNCPFFEITVEPEPDEMRLTLKDDPRHAWVDCLWDHEPDLSNARAIWRNVNFTNFRVLRRFRP